MRDAFGRFGTLSDAKVIMDRETGRSRGFAFISFTESRDAEEALRSLNGEVCVHYELQQSHNLSEAIARAYTSRVDAAPVKY